MTLREYCENVKASYANKSNKSVTIGKPRECEMSKGMTSMVLIGAKEIPMDQEVREDWDKWTKTIAAWVPVSYIKPRCRKATTTYFTVPLKN